MIPAKEQRTNPMTAEEERAFVARCAALCQLADAVGIEADGVSVSSIALTRKVQEIHLRILRKGPTRLLRRRLADQTAELARILERHSALIRRYETATAELDALKATAPHLFKSRQALPEVVH